MYLLPVPEKLQQNEGKFLISYSAEIVLSPSCTEKELRYAQILQEDFKTLLGYTLAITKGKALPGSISLALEGNSQEEGYRLEITPERIVISAPGTRGLLYGVQTLRQAVQQAGAILPCCVIEDKPLIPNRGFYHDVTRGRVPTLDTLKALADRMAYYKLNQLQLYVEHTYLFRNFSEIWRDDTPLTAQEIMELDSYCAGLNIELVPSLACFGHLYKALSSKSYAHLCELEDSNKVKPTYLGRMMHHTVDVTNEESFQMIKEMLEEFMPLFSSKQVNICADETFDLGMGRSKALAEKVGKDRMYLDFLNRVCGIVVEAGRIPQFWGDILLSNPEMVKELPAGSVCLNWGYGAEESEDGTRKMHDAGAIQYCCPGVHGWKHFINRSDFAYQNITRMCNYAEKYHAAGVLNTDWGDFGHINHVRMSTPGMIYGAMFSWNNTPVPFDEANQMISRLAYSDHSQSLVSTAVEISRRSLFDWDQAVNYMEATDSMGWSCTPEEFFRDRVQPEKIALNNQQIDALTETLYALLPYQDETKREQTREYLVMARGIQIWNNVGGHIFRLRHGGNVETTLDVKQTVTELERWWMSYKDLWREQCKEGELAMAQNIINWYCDALRS